MERTWLKFRKHRDVDPQWLHVPARYMGEVTGSNDKGWTKEFCVIEYYGNKALCAWRNNSRYCTGIPFICKIINKNKKKGILYKGKFYPFSRYGVVF